MARPLIITLPILEKKEDYEEMWAEQDAAEARAKALPASPQAPFKHVVRLMRTKEQYEAMWAEQDAAEAAAQAAEEALQSDHAEYNFILAPQVKPKYIPQKGTPRLIRKSPPRMRKTNHPRESVESGPSQVSEGAEGSLKC